MEEPKLPELRELLWIALVGFAIGLVGGMIYDMIKGETQSESSKT